MPQKSNSYIPQGMHHVTAHLYFNGNCKEAIEFYQLTFGLEVVVPIMPWPDGNGVMHAMLKLGDSNIMMADAWPGNYEQGPKSETTVGIFCYVEDCDALFDKGIEAGCEIVEEMMDAFWGDRMGKLKDPFGHTWGFATYKWVYTEEEMQKNLKEWEDSLSD